MFLLKFAKNDILLSLNFANIRSR